MADDLIIKFFREDLTEAEETALLERLSSSVEDALRFGQHAEASYLHYGLPEPKWRGGPPPPGFPSHSGSKLWLWLTLAFLAGLSSWSAWTFWKGNENKPLTAVSRTAPGVSPSLPAVKQRGSILSGEKAVIPDHLPESPAQNRDSLSTAQPAASRTLAQDNLPASTPIPAAVPGRSHTNLEVQVKRAKAGPVTVRVVGPDGAQAVMLYQGMLQPGNWAFDWNGRLANGRAPPAGTYQIQVVSGAVTLNKPVVLRK